MANKKSCFIRKTDDLGRIVIPLDYRRALGVKEGDDMLIQLKNNKVIITRQMNTVYDVRHKDDNVYYAVGGENRTSAILNYLREIGENSSDFIYYRATIAKDNNGKAILTERNGFVGMDELLPNGYKAWWTCPNCGREDGFEYVKGDMYKCQCGLIEDIPFSY